MDSIDNDNQNNDLTSKMSAELIQKLIDNYRSNQLVNINEGLGIDDAHSIWFDLPKLKKFITTIEEEAKNLNPDISEENLGIRFYYASYPKNENWDIMESHSVPQEYAEKHTLIMIPTMKKTSEAGELVDSDFNLISEGEINSGGIVLGENNGILIPPSPPFGISY